MKRIEYTPSTYRVQPVHKTAYTKDSCNPNNKSYNNIEISQEARLQLEIHNIVLNLKGAEFTEEQLLDELEYSENTYRGVDVTKTLQNLLDRWVDTGILQWNLNSYTMV